MTDEGKTNDKDYTPFEVGYRRGRFNEPLAGLDEFVKRQRNPIGPRLQNGNFYSDEALAKRTGDLILI